jgi:hypothetical protein
MIFKEKTVYYKKPIITNKHKATEFTDNYEYYYTENENSKYLGKFIEFSKFNCGNPFDDHDYQVLVFDKDKIFDNKINNIYCKGIPDIDEKMRKIEDILYNGFPIYYKDG